MKTIYKKFNSYAEACNYLNSSDMHSIEPGLDRIKEALEKFDNPETTFPCLHVAGTNGKGSVVKYLESVLHCAGYKTGTFTSPHLITYTERITINGSQISEKDFLEYLNKIFEFLNNEETLYLTLFEILTLMAFLYFRDNQIDIAILEVGMGGTYDATNVIPHPLAAVITDIDIDHKQYLGTTIEQISRDKAGIIKPGTAVVINDNNKGYNQILNVIQEQGARRFKVSSNKYSFKVNIKELIQEIYSSSGEHLSSIRMFGDHQQRNVILALETINVLKDKGYLITEESIKSGLEKTIWPGRAQYFKEENILIDGAHNPAGARTLRNLVDKYFPDKDLIWIIGILDTKEYKEILYELIKQDDIVIFTLPAAHNPASVEDLYEYTVANLQFKALYKKARLIETLQLAENLADDKCLKIIAGSLYLAGEFLELKQKEEPDI